MKRGGLTQALEPLADAGADLSFVIARRRSDLSGSGVVFVGGLRGAKQLKAAHSVGISKAKDVAGLRIQTPDKPGLVYRLSAALAAAGINLRGVFAAPTGRQCVLMLAFDSAEDRDRAAKLLRS
jgi:hypothetical protein